MTRDQNTLSPVLRGAWDSGKLNILTKNSPARASNAHISLLCHITKEELNHRLNKTDIFNGFANRFLWLFVERSKELPEGNRRIATPRAKNILDTKIPRSSRTGKNECPRQSRGPRRRAHPNARRGLPRRGPGNTAAAGKCHRGLRRTRWRHVHAPRGGGSSRQLNGPTSLARRDCRPCADASGSARRAD